MVYIKFTLMAIAACLMAFAIGYSQGKAARTAAPIKAGGPRVILLGVRG